MALPQNIIWDVRTTGNDANGGGFVSGASGTDYSQQNAPQFAYADLVIGSTNTQLTSAAQPFTSAAVGNIVNVTSGTNFTAGRYQVVSVSGAVATMDRAVGTASSTGGSGNLGGSLATPGTAFAAATGGGNSIIYLKAGSYTITTGLSPSGQVALFGYNATHGDNGAGGAGSIITTSTNSINMLSWGNNLSFSVKGIIFSNTATTPGVGLYQNQFNSNECSIINCTISGCSYGISIQQGATLAVFIVGCRIFNCTTGGLRAASSPTFVDSCCFTGNAYGAFLQVASSLTNCIFYSNTGYGALISTNAPTLVARCLFLSNGSDGLQQGAQWPLLASSNIFYGNGGYGINNASSPYPGSQIYNNAFGANASGATHFPATYLPDGTDVTLTANPCTAPSSSIFILNSVAGGGAACKAAGYPGTINGTMGAGYPDIGPLQSVAASGVSNYGYSG